MFSVAHLSSVGITMHLAPGHYFLCLAFLAARLSVAFLMNHVQRSPPHFRTLKTDTHEAKAMHHKFKIVNKYQGVRAEHSKAHSLNWLEEVQRKNYEVQQLRETEEGSRLLARLRSVNLVGGYRVARALKRSTGEQVHVMSVIAEIKRRTPTGDTTPTELAAIADVGLVARQVGDRAG